MMSKQESKEDKMLEVQFVGDDDVLNHILDREGGIECTIQEMHMNFFLNVLTFYFENMLHSN
jgi:hypothetical protein